MKSFALAAAVALAGGALYTAKIRPWFHRWGATDDEVARAMLLDERIPDADLCTTMAVTVFARPEEIWPWIVQIGDPPRAGYYSYTWIERLLGMHVRNANRILPEFQTVEVGQALDKSGTMVVHAVEPGKAIVLGPTQGIDYMQCTWAIALYPVDAWSTRLVTRVRVKSSVRKMLASIPAYTWPFWFVIDPGAFIMERKMLLEIKQRAELTIPAPRPAVAAEKIVTNLTGQEAPSATAAD